MKSEMSARKFLCTKNYMVEGQAITLSGMAQILMCLSQSSSQVSQVTREGMMAVAKLMQIREKVEITHDVLAKAEERGRSTVTFAVDQLDRCTGEINDAANTLTIGVIRELKKLNSDLDKKVNEFTARMDEEIQARTDNLLTDLRSEAADIVAQAREAVTLQQQQAATATPSTTTPPPSSTRTQPCLCSRQHPHGHLDEEQEQQDHDHDQQRAGSQSDVDESRVNAVPPQGSGTYTEVARRGASHPATPNSQLAGDRVRERQRLVYIDLQDTPTAVLIRKMTEEELVKKGNVTLLTMGILVDDRPVGTAFRAAKKQPNGGILFELNSAESASWLKKSDVRALFTLAFDPGAKMKGSSYPCLLKFVPVAYQAYDRDEREQAEQAAGLPIGAMIESRWMKPPGRREKNQRYAHLISTLR